MKDIINIPKNKLCAETQQVNINYGVGGRSAYEEALAEGFVGTRAEWLASLKASGNTVVWEEFNLGE